MKYFLTAYFCDCHSRAVWGFCEHLKESQSTAMLTPMLPMITESLLNLAILFSHEVLSLVLETLAMVLAVRITWFFFSNLSSSLT